MPTSPARIEQKDGKTWTSGHTALEFRLGRTPLVIPTESVRQVIECSVTTPLPLAAPWVCGVAVHEGRILVMLSLLHGSNRGPARLPSRRRARAVILHAADEVEREVDHSIALEISAAATLTQVVSISSISARGDVTLPSWLREATLADGRCTGWIDVGLLLREFS